MTGIEAAFSRFKGKRALVMGLGLWQGGVEAVKFLHRWGASEIVVTDLRDEKTLAPSLDAIKHIPVTLRLGEHLEADFAQAQVVIHSPAVRPDNKFLEAARKAGAEVTQEMSLFIEACPGLTIGITGSNGKTTTTLLCYEMLCELYQRAQPELANKWADPVTSGAESDGKVWLGGNVGTPLINRLEEISVHDVVVLELSSFQLMDWHRVRKSCDFALITNVTANHLDWHKDFDEYVWAKSAIFQYQGQRGGSIVNADDPVAYSLKDDAPRLMFFSTTRSPAQCIATDEKLRGWSFDGSLVSEPILPVFRWIQGERPPAKRSRSAEKLHKERAPKREIGKGIPLEEMAPMPPMILCKREHLRLPGDFNWANLVAAWAVASPLYVHGGFQTVVNAVRRFRGVEHRLEPCGTINGARVYNDSIATDPVATLAALSAFDKGVHLILGGGSKNIDYTELGKRIATHGGIKAIYLQGTTAPAIKAAITSTVGAQHAAPLLEGSTFDEACERAFNALAPGDVLLMSPASTSFYEYAPGKKFANFEERGKHFKALVAKYTKA